MALPATVYRAVVELSDSDRDCYRQLTLTLARHPSETAERLVARLLAYALCYREDLAFTRGICAGDEPDLWVKGPGGRTVLWLEVGLPPADRLLKACRHADRVVLLATGPGSRRWRDAHLPLLAPAANLTILGLDHAFVEELACTLQRTISWSLTVSGSFLYLNSGSRTFEGSLERLQGEPT